MQETTNNKRNHNNKKQLQSKHFFGQPCLSPAVFSRRSPLLLRSLLHPDAVPLIIDHSGMASFLSLYQSPGQLFFLQAQQKITPEKSNS